MNDCEKCEGTGVVRIKFDGRDVTLEFEHLQERCGCGAATTEDDREMLDIPKFLRRGDD